MIAWYGTRTADEAKARFRPARRIRNRDKREEVRRLYQSNGGNPQITD